MGALVAELQPPGPWTSTGTEPAVPEGAITFRLVADLLATASGTRPLLQAPAASWPKQTALAPFILIPLIVTVVPPPTPPWEGLIALGRGVYENSGAWLASLQPAEVCTCTGTTPVPPGAVTETDVPVLLTAVGVTGPEAHEPDTVPKQTSSTPVKLTPPILTFVPAVPASGVTLEGRAADSWGRVGALLTGV